MRLAWNLTRWRALTSRSERRPGFRLACCLCRKPIPARSDVLPLDDEWARRYPRMVGRLACHRCALSDAYYWDCAPVGDVFAPGHIPAAINGPDIDSWSHAGPEHTQVAAVLNFPESAMVQGGAAYLRWAARWPRAAPETRARLVEFLADWDARQ